MKKTKKLESLNNEIFNVNDELSSALGGNNDAWWNPMGTTGGHGYVTILGKTYSVNVVDKSTFGIHWDHELK